MNTLKFFFTLYFFFLTLGFNCHANEENTLSYQHGIAMHGDLKYKKNFPKFDYANENAFKGGE